MEHSIVCPLGCECERIVDDRIETCAWYVKIQGKNPQDGNLIDEHKCAIAWQPILMVEGSGVSRNIAASVQSLRNETIKRQDAALRTLNEKDIEELPNCQ